MSIDWMSDGPSQPSLGASTPTGPLQSASDLSSTVPQATQDNYQPMSQEEVDKLNPIERVLRGIENAKHEEVFSKAGAAPFVGDILGTVGNVAGAVAQAGVIAPIQTVATAASHIPLGWVGDKGSAFGTLARLIRGNDGPVSADENFAYMGGWIKEHGTVADYQAWQAAKAHADADVLDGGNQKYNFLQAALQHYDRQSKEGVLGNTPALMAGPAGSLGGMIAQAFTGFTGVGAGNVQGFLGNAGVFDPGQVSTKPVLADLVADVAAGRGAGSDDADYAVKQFNAGKMTAEEAQAYLDKNAQGGRSRVVEAAARLQRGDEVSAVERDAATQYLAGKWTEQHANDVLIREGQSVTRNPIGQIAVGLATDPTMLAMGGAGWLAKAAKIGVDAIEVGGRAAEAFKAAEELSGAAKIEKLAEAEKFTQMAKAETAYQKAGQTLARVTNDPVLGPIARAGHAMVDPFQLIPISPIARTFKSLLRGSAIDALGTAMNRFAIKDVQKIGREFGKEGEINTALASIAEDKGTEFVAANRRDIAIANDRAEALAASPVDVSDAVEAQAKDISVRLADYITSIRKYRFTPDNIAVLSGRMAKAVGGDAKVWFDRISKMSLDTVSTLHMVASKLAETDFVKNALNRVDAAYDGSLPLRDMVLGNVEIFDNVSAQDFVKKLQAIRGREGEAGAPIKDAQEYWNATALEQPQIAEIGHAEGNAQQLDELIASLEHDLKQGQFHRRATDEELAHPALAPIKEWLDAHTIDGKRLYNVVFRPAEDISWGLKQDRITGELVKGRVPSIAHSVDTVYNPGFTDTTRDLLGRINIVDHGISPGKIDAIMRPVDSLAAFGETLTDVVSGRRLVLNIEQRFHANMATRLGIPEKISKDVWKVISDVGALQQTNVRGIVINDSVWKQIAEKLPRDLVQSGKVNVRNVMGAMLDASEGDLRIMGATSKLTQQMRNQLRYAGISGANRIGDLTVTRYNQFRYIQPTFMIQKITDAPYFMALHGIMPVGGGELKTDLLRAVRRIEENMGTTGTARDFAFDYPERALHSNWTDGIRARIDRITGGDASKLDRIQGMTGDARDVVDSRIDRYVANNMTKDLSTRMGSVVRDSLDDIANLIKTHPDMEAELTASRDAQKMLMEDVRAEYSLHAGHLISEDEAGVKFIQENMASMRRVKATKGGIDTSGLRHEMDMHSPADFGEVKPIHPEQLAAEMGFDNARDLREAVSGKFNPQTQQFEKGILGMARAKEILRDEFGASKEYIGRFERYFGNTWDGYFTGLARPVAEGGLDLSPKSLAKAQSMIRVWAKDRGMDPWQYLSQVVGTNLGAEGLDTHIQKLVNFLDKGAEAQIDVEDILAYFKGHMDLSQQKEMIAEYMKTRGAAKVATGADVQAAYNAGDVAKGQALNKEVAMARGGTAESGGVIGPDAASGWKPGDPVPAQSNAERRLAAMGAEVAAPKPVNIVEGPVSGVYARYDPATRTVHVPAGVDDADLAHEVGHAFESQFDAKLADREFTAGLGSFDGDTMKFVRADGKSFKNPSEAAAQTFSDYVTKKPLPSEVTMWIENRLAESPGWDNMVASLRSKTAAEHVATGRVEAAVPAAISADDYLKNVFPEEIRQRALSGVEHANPRVEEAYQHFSKWAQSTLQGTQTRKELKMIVESIPTGHAAPFNRFEALLQETLHDKIRLMQADVFLNAEMATNRNVLMRSINHPMFGIYPASYMWGKVLPLTAKALARNPYGLTYGINEVQRQIAIQREYDPEAAIPAGIDKSASAFLLGYLTPSLPWETMQAQTPPWAHQFQKGDFNPFDLLKTEFHTMSPERWWSYFEKPIKEVGSVAAGAFQPQAPDTQEADDPRLQSLVQQPNNPAPAAPAFPSGPVKATGLSPILTDEMDQLQRVLSGR